MTFLKALLVLVVSLVGLVVGALLGFLGAALVLGPAARIGEVSSDLALWGTAVGGLVGAVLLGGLTRRALRTKA